MVFSLRERLFLIEVVPKLLNVPGFIEILHRQQLLGGRFGIYGGGVWVIRAPHAEERQYRMCKTNFGCHLGHHRV